MLEFFNLVLFLSQIQKLSKKTQDSILLSYHI